MPKNKARGPLTDSQLGEVAEASLANAVNLINEARLLFEAEAIPRSYSLAVLAAEEFGKCQLAVGTVGRSEVGPDYWKGWWAVFYGHGPKLARAVGIVRPLLPVALIETFIGLLERALTEQRREVGFYVDVIDGTLLCPPDAIDRSEASDAIECFGAVINAYASVFAEVGLAVAYMEAQEGSEAIEMRAAIATGDPERIRETWEATTGFRPDDDQIDEIMKMLRH